MPPLQATPDTNPPETRDGPKQPDGRGPDLDPDEQKRAEEEESLNASVTYEVVRREGEKELQRSPQALAWSGLAAGLSMGFILVAEGLLRSHLPDAPWRPLVAKLGYTVGFLIVMLGSQQLYTENTLAQSRAGRGRGMTRSRVSSLGRRYLNHGGHGGHGGQSPKAFLCVLRDLRG